jgi:hypothetical protein
VLPTSRDTNATGATPVKSGDINDLQDCIIGMKQPAHWRWSCVSRGWLETNITFDTSGGIGCGSAKANAGAAVLAGMVIPTPPVGTRITGLKARFKGTGAAATAHVYLQRANGDGTMTNIGDLAIVNPPNAWATYTLDPIGAISTLADPEALYLAATLPLLNMELSNFAIKVDRL